MSQGSKIVGILVVPLVLSLLSMDIIVFNDVPHQKLFLKYDVYASINASKEAVDIQARNLIRYLQDKEPLQPALLNEKEITHMADVKKIVKRGHQLLLISVMLLFSCFIMSPERKKLLLYGCCVTILLVGIASLGKFEALFYQTHLILFSNEFWLLNPATDNLIRMYPVIFFKETAVRIGYHIIGMALGGMAIGLYKSKRRREAWQKS